MLTTNTLLVESKVPFGDSVYGWLNVKRSHTFEEFTECSRPYEPTYLAWEEVRLGRNPFFEIGTGFEGYFIERCASPEEALERLLTLGREILTNIARLHHHDPHFHSVLMKTLFQECDDIDAILEWSTELGAALSRLRCHLHTLEASVFQLETYTILGALPTIEYTETHQTIRQRYELAHQRVFPNRITVAVESLKAADQDPWLVVKHIGKFGHPLVRELLALTSNHF